MNHDERFQQRWEFRRKEDEEDSSSDYSKSSSSGAEPSDKKLKLVNALVLPENEDYDASKCSWQDKIETENDVSKCANALRRKARSSKKKDTVPSDKPKRVLAGKDNGNRKRKRKWNGNDDSNDMAMLEDLRTFAGSLIHELNVAREEMSEQLVEEVRTLVASRPVLGFNKKKGACMQKRKMQPRKRKGKGKGKGNESNVKVNESNAKSQKRSTGSSKTTKKGNMATSNARNPAKAVKGTAKHNKAPAKAVKGTTKRPSSTKTKDLSTEKSNAVSDEIRFPQIEVQKGDRVMPSVRAPMVSSTDSSRVVSMPFLVLPPVMLKSQLQNPRNPNPISNSSSGVEVGKLKDAKTSLRGFPGFKPNELFGSFPCISSRSPGLSSQSCSQTASIGVGFPVPLQQGLQEISSNISSSRSVGGNQVSCENVLGNNISKNMDGEFVSRSSQDVMKDSQGYMTAAWGKQQ